MGVIPHQPHALQPSPAAGLLAAAAGASCAPWANRTVVDVPEGRLINLVRVQKTGTSTFVEVLAAYPLTPCNTSAVVAKYWSLWGTYVDGRNSTETCVDLMVPRLLDDFPNLHCAGGQQQNAHVSLAAMQLAALAAGKMDVQFVTLLREPVARVLSEAANALAVSRAGVGFLWEYELPYPTWEGGLPPFLANFLGCDACVVGWGNRQVRMLGADGANLTEQAADGRMLQKALRRLDAMAFVGIVEKFEESMLLFSYVFRDRVAGFRSFSYENDGTAEEHRKSLRPSEEEVRKIASLNTLDTALYSRAIQRFDCQWAEMVADTSFEKGRMHFASDDNITYHLVDNAMGAD